LENLPNSFFSHAEAIYHLEEVGIEVRQTRVADWLGVSRANVSQVIGRMQNSGLVELNDDLKLSQKGEYLAKMISRRHRIIERFLTEVLDLPWEKVYAETKKWENVLSPVTEEAMLKILGNPKTGPFGNPIPYSNYFEGPMNRLYDVDTNKKYSIIKISEELKRDSSVITFLQKNQILPGNNIFISDTNKYSITVSVAKNQFFGLDKYIAKRVYVN
jgi:DtxR family Mn-dependent transcriptional regulator